MAVWNRLGTWMIAVGATAVLCIPAAANGAAHTTAPRVDAPAVAGTTVVNAAAPSAVHSVSALAPARSSAAAAAGPHVAGTPSTGGVTAPTVAASGRTGGTASTKCNDGTVTYTPTTLWPPNHKMQTITITYTDNDGDGDNTTITVGTITDDQAAADGSDELNGSGQPTDKQGLDWAGTGNTGSGKDGGPDATTTAQVRAERSGTDKTGRTYDIKVTCTDSGGTDATEVAGVTQTVDLFVTVPHDQGHG